MKSIVYCLIIVLPPSDNVSVCIEAMAIVIARAKAESIWLVLIRPDAITVSSFFAFIITAFNAHITEVRHRP